MQVEEKECEFDKEQNSAIQGLEKDSHLLRKSIKGPALNGMSMRRFAVQASFVR